MARSGPSIRYFLLTANAFLLLLPVGAIVFLRLWDKHLVRVTEERLIAESVAVASAWRAHLTVRGETPPSPITVPSPRLADGYETLAPIDVPPPRRPEPGAGDEAGRAFAAELIEGPGAAGSETSILDSRGCVVSSSRVAYDGACVPDRVEVRSALTGSYAVAVRERSASDTTDELPGRPHGRVRVFTAMPIVAGEKTIGVVYSSRPSSSPLEAVWTLRQTIVVALIGCLLIMVTVTLFLSWAISRPVWAITAAADAVARGEPSQGFRTSGLIPAEVNVLAGALERMTAQLDARARYVAEFANQVSHELKTPLTSIRGAVELMHDEWQHMDERQRSRFLGNIEADVDRTLRLVQRLLQLARIEHTADEVEQIDVLEFLSHLADRYGDRISLEAGNVPARIAMNADHLETALANLIDNAVRHGEGHLVKVVARAESGGRLRVDVIDRGRGISPGNQPRVFERFFTTERDRGGTGLGLAIVKAIAESRGGSVTFQTDPAGTTFTIVV